MEHRPEHRGTPYEVQFSLLGEQLLGPDRLPRVEAFESSSDQRYFPETGHSVNYAFLRYFTSRGGLDSLGFPITEELQEGGRPEPWRVDDAPAAYVAGQIKGIIGLELPVARIEGKWKLSQNRPAADKQGVIAGFREQGERGAILADLVAERAGLT